MTGLRLRRSPGGAAVALAGAALALGSAASCGGPPREIVFVVTSDAPLTSDTTLAIWLNGEATPRVTKKLGARAAGELGTVVATPASEAVATATARVVLATGVAPELCVDGQGRPGCVVAARRERFPATGALRLGVPLHARCDGVACGPELGCGSNGTCVDLAGLPTVTGPDGGDEGPADAYEAEVLRDRPRHYWRLDEKQGATVARDRMGGANGVYEGFVQLGVTGALASSARTGLSLAGKGRVVVPAAIALGYEYTVEAWVREAEARSGALPVVESTVVDGAVTFGFRLSRPPAAARFEIFRGLDGVDTVESPSSFFAGYTHVVAVVGASQLVVYLNGDPVLTSPIPSAREVPSATTSTVVLGGIHGYEYGFIGALDEIALYDYPLDPTRVAAHARHGKEDAP